MADLCFRLGHLTQVVRVRRLRFQFGRGSEDDGFLELSIMFLFLELGGDKSPCRKKLLRIIGSDIALSFKIGNPRV